jgi:hypothetical protein
MSLTKYDIGKEIINYRRDYYQTHKISTCLIEEIEREKAKYISPYIVVIAKEIIQSDKCRKKINEKSVVEQQGVGRVVCQLSN